MRTFVDETFVEMRSHGCHRGWTPPHINLHHIDGPVIVFSDGQMHWLTLWQRLLLWLGRIDADGLQNRLRPRMIAGGAI